MTYFKIIEISGIKVQDMCLKTQKSTKPYKILGLRKTEADNLKKISRYSGGEDEPHTIPYNSI